MHIEFSRGKCLENVHVGVQERDEKKYEGRPHKRQVVVVKVEKTVSEWCALASFCMSSGVPLVSAPS